MLIQLGKEKITRSFSFSFNFSELGGDWRAEGGEDKRQRQVITEQK